MNKSIRLADQTKLLDKFQKSILENNGRMRGEVLLTNPATGKAIFKKNKIILPGSILAATSLFDVESPVITPSYNTALGLDNSVSTSQPEAPVKVCLFAVGTDGCGSESSQVYDVDYTKWIKPEALVPFRYQAITNDLSDSARQIYYGRKTIAESGFIAYYMKAFDQNPIFTIQYVDGTPVDNNIYTSSNDTEVEAYVEVVFSITKEDCRDFFIETTGITTANISSISLLSAWSKEVDGYKYYQDIRPVTKLNIPKEPLEDLSKGLNIVYHIYF